MCSRLDSALSRGTLVPTRLAHSDIREISLFGFRRRRPPSTLAPGAAASTRYVPLVTLSRLGRAVVSGDTRERDDAPRGGPDADRVAKDGEGHADRKHNLDVAEHLQRDGGRLLRDYEVAQVEEERDEPTEHHERPPAERAFSAQPARR